jgi:hypothetical protein
MWLIEVFLLYKDRIPRGVDRVGAERLFRDNGGKSKRGIENENEIKKKEIY